MDVPVKKRRRAWQAAKLVHTATSPEAPIKERRRKAVIAAICEWRARKLMSVREAAVCLDVPYSQLSPANLAKCSLEYLLDILERTDYTVDLALHRVQNAATGQTG